MQVPVLHAPPAVLAEMPAAFPMQVPAAVPVPTAVPAQVPTLAPTVPVIIAQPQPLPQVVVNVQPSNSMPMSFRPITWSTGLFQCFEDIPICLLGCLCPFLLPCYLSSLFGEVCCLGMLPGAMFALRTGVRERYRIPGDLLNDYCSICCCLACALCQMAREVKGREWQHCRFPIPPPNLHLHLRRQH